MLPSTAVFWRPRCGVWASAPWGLPCLLLTGSLYCHRGHLVNTFLIFFCKNFSTFAQNVANEQLTLTKKIAPFACIAPSSPSATASMTLACPPLTCPKMSLDMPQDCPNQRPQHRPHDCHGAHQDCPNIAPCLTALLLPCFVLLRRLPRTHARALLARSRATRTHAHMRVCAPSYLCYLILYSLSFFVCHVCLYIHLYFRATSISQAID